MTFSFSRATLNFRSVFGAYFSVVSFSHVLSLRFQQRIFREAAARVAHIRKRYTGSNLYSREEESTKKKKLEQNRTARVRVALPMHHFFARRKCIFNSTQLNRRRRHRLAHLDDGYPVHFDGCRMNGVPFAFYSFYPRGSGDNHNHIRSATDATIKCQSACEMQH